MPRTNSWSFPNLLDPTRNCVSIVEDDKSIVNRSRLLMLSDPTELYNNPNFGVGMKKFLFQYNTENVRARLQDNIREQLRVFEPCVVADETTFSDGLLFTGGDIGEENPNHLKMTVGLRTIFGDDLKVTLNDDE